jgi:hypothetical protein
MNLTNRSPKPLRLLDTRLLACVTGGGGPVASSPNPLAGRTHAGGSDQHEIVDIHFTFDKIDHDHSTANP